MARAQAMEAEADGLEEEAATLDAQAQAARAEAETFSNYAAEERNKAEIAQARAYQAKNRADAAQARATKAAARAAEAARRADEAAAREEHWRGILSQREEQLAKVRAISQRLMAQATSFAQTVRAYDGLVMRDVGACQEALSKLIGIVERYEGTHL